MESVNCAASLVLLNRFEEVRSLLRKKMPVARRVCGDQDLITLKMRRNYAMMLYRDDGSTISDLHEAVEMLDDLALIARRVLGISHPEDEAIELALKEAQAALRAREALLAKYLLYGASALAIAAFALARSRGSR
jgi:hypothetical protein